MTKNVRLLLNPFTFVVIGLTFTSEALRDLVLAGQYWQVTCDQWLERATCDEL